MRRLLGAASVAAVAVGLLPVSPVSAAVSDICPGPGQTDQFTDDEGNVHESNIEKAADNGILEGTGANTFSPNANVTRGQTATIVIRAAGNVLFPAGRFAPRTGAAQAFQVTPTEAVTQTTDTGRQFSVTVPAGVGALRMQLFACANVRASDLTFAGTAPGLPGNVAVPGTVNSNITVVGGNPVTPANAIELPATTTGTVTFTVSGAAGECVLPVVYRDADGDDALDLGTNNRPSEPFGVGGRTTFAAAQAATGAIPSGTVELVDTANNLFQQGGASFVYGRAGDIFQLSVAGACTNSTLEVFEQRLSRDDAVTGTYNRAGGSLFCLVDQAPLAPTGVAAPAESRAVTFGDSPTPTVASYNVYRAAGIPGIVGGAAASCPTLTTAGAYASIGTVTDTSPTAGATGSYSFTDATAPAGSLQCYAVSAVDRSGDEGPLAGPVGPRTTVAADVTPPSFASATATAGTRTVTVTYNEPIRCASVAANGSDFDVDVTTAGFLDPNPATAAVCVNPTATGFSTTVQITVTNVLTADQVVRVTAQAGADGNTVLDASGNAQTAGQAVQTTAEAAAA